VVVGVGVCKIKVDSNFSPVFKVKCTKFHQDRSKTVDLHTKQTNKQTFSFIPGVEWILVHRHFTCKSKNPRILAPLIILEQIFKYKSCRVLKMVPNSYLFCFLTSSGSTQ
jgi:hypothetical protein